MENIILVNREDIRNVELEERINFIRSVFHSMDLPIEESFPENGEEWSTDQRIKLRKVLSEFNIDLVESVDGGVKIYVDKQIIAEWFKPFFYLKQDLSEPDPKNRLYAEVHTKSWSLFEDIPDESENLEEDELDEEHE